MAGRIPQRFEQLHVIGESIRILGILPPEMAPSSALPGGEAGEPS